jgi:uncharacterized membrane protein
MPKSKETLGRTAIKTLCWRATATTITIISTWAISGSVEDALKVGAIDMLFKLSGHFAYEKLWSYISWGYIDDSITESKYKENGGDEEMGGYDEEKEGVGEVTGGGDDEVTGGGDEEEIGGGDEEEIGGGDEEEIMNQV